MILGIHQLHYIPWLRYFHKIALSDTFVVLDDIQFNKNGWQNRNKIKSSTGELILTIPIYNKFQQNLDEVHIDNKSNWRKKHWNTICMNYNKAPYFSKYEGSLKSLYDREWVMLNDINYTMLHYFLKELQIDTRLLLSSELNIGETATERLINICKSLGADNYLTGAYALDTYLDEKAFSQNGISMEIQQWNAPTYNQLYQKNGFFKDLSILDLLLNEGENARNILLNNTIEK
ncbi:MAG: WbqC family protein [Candidatus Ancaeobacter aquaticus]|nr:WbqC family protein [Candidatus Ancaeobacter aquaticus]